MELLRSPVKTPLMGRIVRAGRFKGPGERDYVAALLTDPCVYCAAHVATIDHIDALATGAPDSWENVAGACRSCNERKGTEKLLLALLRFRGYRIPHPRSVRP